jgi:hypothetical protein
MTAEAREQRIELIRYLVNRREDGNISPNDALLLDRLRSQIDRERREVIDRLNYRT